MSELYARVHPAFAPLHSAPFLFMVRGLLVRELDGKYLTLFNTARDDVEVWVIAARLVRQRFGATRIKQVFVSDSNTNNVRAIAPQAMLSHSAKNARIIVCL